jgi:hypothetical protein
VGLQARSGQSWNGLWGIAIEHAFDAGRVSKERFTQYLKGRARPRLVMETRTPAAGDTVGFMLGPHWRAGTNAPVFIQLRPVGEWTSRVRGAAVTGEVRSIGWGAHRLDGLILLPDKPGRITIEFDVVCTWGDAVIDNLKSRVNPFDPDGHESMWRKFPPGTVARRISIDLDLQPSKSPRVTMDDKGLAAAQVRRLCTNVYVGHARSEHGQKVHVGIGFRGNTLDMAFDGTLRQGDRQWPLDWAMCDRISEGMSFTAAAPGLDPTQPVDIVLSSGPGMLERPYWMPTIWKGQLQFNGVKVREKTEIP